MEKPRAYAPLPYDPNEIAAEIKAVFPRCVKVELKKGRRETMAAWVVIPCQNMQARIRVVRLAHGLNITDIRASRLVHIVPLGRPAKVCLSISEDGVVVGDSNGSTKAVRLFR